MYKVLITAAGTGSRLKQLTQATNKSLLHIGKKRVIDYIVESYPNNIPLIIAIGYYGNDIKLYMQSHYPNRDITFVPVSPFEGPGSSLAYSMLSAAKHLQSPFIFHCNDTIVLERLPSPEEENWDGIIAPKDKEFEDIKNYSTVTIDAEKIVKIQRKGASQYDGLHIGIVGIKDYKIFWKILDKLYKENPQDQMLNDCSVINVMLQKKMTFTSRFFPTWLDTGNLKSWKETREELMSKI